MAEEMNKLTDDELDRVSGGVIETAYGNYEDVIKMVRSCSSAEEFIKIYRTANDQLSKEASDEFFTQLYDFIDKSSWQ